MRFENLLLKSIKIGVIFVLFTPLILGPFGLTLSAYPKAVFFRSLIEIIFVLYLLLIFLNQKYLPKVSPLVIAISIFVGILVLTSFTGINFHRSFFGDAERAIGVILYLHLLVFFIILISIFNKKKDWFNLLKLTVIVSGISSLAGILQKLGVYSFYGLSLPRISGTLSNPDFFAPFMVLSIFLTLFVLMIEKEKDLKITWIVILFLNFFTLILSGSRGAWTGLMVGMAFFLPFWFFCYSGLSRKKRIYILLGILFLCILFFLMALNLKQFGLDRNYFYMRFISIFEFSLGSRGEVWKIGFDAWKEKPILGWGPESFGFIYDKYFRAYLFQYIPEGMFFDYPHNKVINLMTSSGLLGILSYLSIFFVAFYLLFKKNNTKQLSSEKQFYSAQFSFKNSTRLILFAFLISYFVQNLFVFDTICTFLFFFIVLGFINNNFPSSAIFQERTKDKKSLPKLVMGIVISPFIFLSFLTFYQINWKPTKSAVMFPRFVVYEQTDPQKAILGYNEGTNKNTVYDKDFRLIMAERALLVLEKGWAKNVEKEIVEILSNKKPLLEKDLEKPDRRTNDTYEYLARINQRIYLASKNPAAFEEMEDVLKRALSFNNERPEFYRLMGELRILQGEYEKGEEFFQKMYELSPDTFQNRAEFYKQLGVAYSKAGDKVKAVENFRITLDMEYYFKKITSNSIIKGPVSFAEVVALIYCRDLNDLEICREIYERAIEIYPEYQNILQQNLNILIEKYKPEEL